MISTTLNKYIFSIRLNPPSSVSLRRKEVSKLFQTVDLRRQNFHLQTNHSWNYTSVQLSWTKTTVKRVRWNKPTILRQVGLCTC